MSRVEELEKFIDALPEEDYVRLRQWFSERDWQKWDKQIAADSASNNLDFLRKEALDAKSNGKLREI